LGFPEDLRAFSKFRKERFIDGVVKPELVNNKRQGVGFEIAAFSVSVFPALRGPGLSVPDSLGITRDLADGRAQTDSLGVARPADPGSGHLRVVTNLVVGTTALIELKLKNVIHNSTL